MSITPRLYSTMHLEQKDKKSYWVIDTMEPHVSIRFKQLFPKIPIYATVPYKIENTIDICADLYWFSTRYPFELSKEDTKALSKGKKLFDLKIEQLQKILSTPSYTHDMNRTLFKEGQALRHYQEQIVALLWLNKTVLCGDDLGLGKTYATIGSLMDKKSLPAAIVVQTHLQDQWRKKTEEFSHLKAHVVRSKKPYTLPEADVYIFRYSQIAGWVEIFASGFFKATAFDEVQELRTGLSSDKGNAAKTLCQNTHYRLGLSATPIYNYADELYNIYDILEEGILGKREDFIREWGSSSINNRITIKEPKALGAYLLERGIFIRRTKADVGQELPQVNTIVETVAYDERTVVAVERIARELATRTLEGTFAERGQAARDLDLLMRHTTGVSKARYVAEFAKIFLENNEPIILAGWHRDVYDIWLRELKDYSPVMYTGSESVKEKNQAIEDFMSGKTNCFIISLRSGAGIDGLQHRCSTVIYGELDWSKEVHKQLRGRVDRDGQKDPVMEIYLVSDYGSDPLMLDLIGTKASQSEAILNPFGGVKTVANDKSRLIMLASKVLNKDLDDISLEKLKTNFELPPEGSCASSKIEQIINHPHEIERPLSDMEKRHENLKKKLKQAEKLGLHSLAQDIRGLLKKHEELQATEVN